MSTMDMTLQHIMPQRPVFGDQADLLRRLLRQDEKKIEAQRLKSERRDSDLQMLLLRYAENKKALSMITELKSKPCTDCGFSYPEYVMDFDHVLGEKVANISKLRGSKKWRLLVEELSKCELVCSNCHRERTHQRHVKRMAMRDVIDAAFVGFKNRKSHGAR